MDRITAANDQMGDAVSKCIRLAESGPGDDQQWSSDVTVGC